MIRTCKHDILKYMVLQNQKKDEIFKAILRLIEITF